MFISRDILPHIEKELAKKEITVITGMRRVGKTTLLTCLFEKIDSENKYIFEEENYDNIWNNLAPFGITHTEKAYLFVFKSFNRSWSP